MLVTEAGFAPEDWAEGRILPFEHFWTGQDLPEDGLAVDFPNDRDAAELEPWLDRLELVRIAFPAMGDGRGFSLAARLRAMGYAGRLRAAGPLIADQFGAAQRVGFDEVEVPDEIARRQPEATWRRPEHADYRDRMTLDGRRDSRS